VPGKLHVESKVEEGTYLTLHPAHLKQVLASLSSIAYNATNIVNGEYFKWISSYVNNSRREIPDH